MGFGRDWGVKFGGLSGDILWECGRVEDHFGAIVEEDCCGYLGAIGGRNGGIGCEF